MFNTSDKIVNCSCQLCWLIIFVVTFESTNCAPIISNQIGLNSTINPVNPANFLPTTDFSRLFLPLVNGDLFHWGLSGQLTPRQAIYENENANKTFGRQRQLGSTLNRQNNNNYDMFADYGGGGGGDDFFSQMFSFLFGTTPSGGPGYYGPNSGGGFINGVNEQGRDGTVNTGSNSGFNSGSNSNNNNNNFGMTSEQWQQYLQLIQALAQDNDGGGGGGIGDAGQLINMAMSVMGGGL